MVRTTWGAESIQILQRAAIARGEEIDTKERRPSLACTLPRDLPLCQVALTPPSWWKQPEG